MTALADSSQPPPLFTAFSIRKVTFRNRIVVTPMCQYVADDGHVQLWHCAHHSRFALSGIGGAIVEATGVTRDGRITLGCLGIYLDEHVGGLKRIVDIYHSQGIPVGIQLSHAGRKASAAVPLKGAAPLADADPDRAWTAMAPSAVALTDRWPIPREMTEHDIETIIEAFGIAAERACRAGFDFLEIHGAHGYLVNSYFSPIANRRSDSWGGAPLENRMRFPLGVAAEIRRRIPAEMPVFYRASVVDGLEGGVTIEDTAALARELKACGVDLIDCSSGGITGPSGRAFERPAPGYLVPYAREVRERAGVPTMAVGLIVEAGQANAIVANGDADLVAMGRQLLAEPSFPYHAAQALGHPKPESVLPESYAFFLERRNLG
ncbi:MAG: NADH:flavin oxidoreductase/NADH oxidase [Gammaproteobacteria bacterium]|nr:NADH:flavin oxidoreductase/NADH oxidase [Gammaproteobacteria bacterium]